MSTSTHRELACLATASYSTTGWSVAIRERDARPVAPDPDPVHVPGHASYLDLQQASRTLFDHGWSVLGDPKPWGEWHRQTDGSWSAYVDTAAGCPRSGCETARFECRWPYRDALVECEVDRIARGLVR